MDGTNPPEIDGVCKGLTPFPKLAGGLKPFIIFTPKLGEMILFDEHIFQVGWFNHQLEKGIFRFHVSFRGLFICYLASLPVD